MCVRAHAWQLCTVWGDCGNGTGGLRYWMEPPEPEAVGSLPRRADSRPATQRGIRPEKPFLISNSHSSAPTRTLGNNIAISVLHRCTQENVYPHFDLFSPPSSFSHSILFTFVFLRTWQKKSTESRKHLRWVWCDFLKYKCIFRAFIFESVLVHYFILSSTSKPPPLSSSIHYYFLPSASLCG